jgi:hypothetical protein
MICLQIQLNLRLKKYQKSYEYKCDPTSGRTKSHSFRMGMTSRLGQRLREIKANRMASNQEKGLVLYNKMNLAIEKYIDMIGGEEICNCHKNMMCPPHKRKKYKDCCGKMKTERRKNNIGSYGAFCSGKVAGDNVTITTGLNDEKAKQLSLK